MNLTYIRSSFRQFYISTPRTRLGLSGVALLLLLGTLWLEIDRTKNLGSLWHTFQIQLQSTSWVWFVAALLLMPLNWLVETLKWHKFIHRYDPIPLGRALLAVWVGVSFSLFTPNRIGEYGGRMLFIRQEHQWKAALINLVGNYSQYLILLTSGTIGGICFLYNQGLLYGFWLYTLSGGALLILFVTYLIYFNIRRALPFLKRLSKKNWWCSIMREAEVLEYFNTYESAQLLAWAMLRYGIYSTQYFLLLVFFGINPGFLAAYTGIALIFMVQTCMPLPPLAGLFTRGNMAVWVWASFGTNTLGALSSSFSLWIINLILPALIGTFSLFHVNITKQPGYEDD